MKTVKEYLDHVLGELELDDTHELYPIFERIFKWVAKNPVNNQNNSCKFEYTLKKQFYCK